MLKNKFSVTTTSEELSETHPGFLWNETAISNYKNNLVSESAKEKARELVNLENTSTTVLAGNICEFMLESVTNAKVKTKKRTADLKNSEKWFDSECRSNKENLSRLSNKFSKSPEDDSLRRQVFEAKKNFKKIILMKKRKYRTKKLTND